MARIRKRKTNKGQFSAEDMREAVELVENKTMSIRKAASVKGLNYVTLYRYVKRRKTHLDPNNMKMTPNYDVRRVFTEEQENSLEHYLIQCAKMCYGLDTIETRRLAYDMAIHNKISKIPPTWHIKKMAGKDWLYYFRKRHPLLSLRRPEACSLARATAFNRHNVSTFFGNLKTVLERCPALSDGTRIFNLDETGISTVQTPKCVLAPKGIKQLNKATSAERGTLVTVCCIIQASGSALPPAIIFPRVHFKDYMLTGAPPGSLGLATSSGWMNTELFVKVIEHFIKSTHSTKEYPTLLILDNHESHLSINALNLAKENGVTMLTIPPHCSNKMQPLDISVYRSFQSNYNSALESWMLNHPGTPVTIYQVASFVGIAFERSMTPTNIMSGFRKSGIFPYDENIFTADDFLSSYVSDRPCPEQPDHLAESSTINNCSLKLPASNSPVTPPTASTSRLNDDPLSATDEIVPTDAVSGCGSNIITPEIFRGYPKAANRKDTVKRKRRKGVSCIATDTPIKNEIEERAREREKKNVKRVKKDITKKVLVESSNSSENDIDVILEDSDSEDENVLPEPEESAYHTEPRKGGYVVIKFYGKRQVHYVAKILRNVDENGDYEVSYLKKISTKQNRFIFPDEPDIALVSQYDIVLALPEPKQLVSTKRQRASLVFEVDINNYNIL